MKAFSERKSGLNIFFVLAILLMVVSFVSAADEVKNKIPGDTPGAVTQAAPEHQGSVHQRVADPKGPPVNPGPGWYVKTRGKNAGTYKYFVHGHPENKSEWDYYGPNPPPYGS